MPREIPVGNGDLLINFDEMYRVRDIYYPCVGRYNHTGGHVQRFGVWADGEFSWVDSAAWRRELRYMSDTLVTEVRLVNDQLGLELLCNDAVDFHEPVYFRRIKVRDRSGSGGGVRDVRVFYHIDLSIKESPVGDTCDFDPETAGLVMYKDDSYFLVNATAEGETQPGIDHWSIGTKRVGGAEGTWRDAEDGVLGKNAIAQGSVDATVGVNLRVPRGGEATCTIWMACGDSYDRVRELNRVIRTKGVDKMFSRTEAYWRLWSRKDVIDTGVLPAKVRELFIKSQLILRTQIDNRGAIIAATDSDISHFAGDHYAYCWPRDGALVAHALIQTGQSELSRNFFRYCGRVISKNGYFMHKYTPAGHLASSWHPWVINGKPVLPIQQDETALVLWSLRQHFEAFRDVEFIKPLYNALVAQPAQWLMGHVDNNGLPLPSWDLWEERRGIHTFTVAATIGALNAAAAFARDFGDVERAEAIQAGAESMREAMVRHLWNTEQSRFARMATPVEAEGRPGVVAGYRLDMTRDSANYALWAFGAMRAGNPMVVAEMASLWDRLWVKTEIGGCARYERDYYHQVERDKTDAVPGNPWVICTLWHAQHRIALAKTPEELRGALPLLEWAAARANKSGVLAEQFHPYTGEMMSVSPLTWSHAVVITTVMEYMAKHTKLIAEANAVEGWAETGVA
ncbi:MAG TPA: glycoside hydrolase family 15 protein [Phycisphaerales bacterium]|nr:glycoside hydrolase family 15 protein [Phycisphaerales bacterium]